MAKDCWSMLIGLVGKPSSGKSSFFKALTMMDVKIASYPFTTIDPNKGVAFVKAVCPHKELGRKCDPNNSQCMDGTRLIPIKIIDVAGLVPGAHEGRGKGNKFLDDLRQADALIHVVDMSGTTDENGLPTDNHDPASDIKWLKEELELWIAGIIGRVSAKTDASLIVKQLSGFTPREEVLKQCVKDAGNDAKKLAHLILMRTKPMLIAANKMDLPESKNNLERASKDVGNKIVPCSAEMEIALRLASEKKLATYNENTREISISQNASSAQSAVLNKIKEFINKYGSTGIQKCIDEAVFSLLGLIEVYPVENENSWSDSRGRVLPDVYLVPKGTTAKEFASIVHTDLAKNFITAIDGRTKMRIGEGRPLKKGDVIKIVAGK
ncbi:MAG: redox-regulated ATPase YchF [Candidatus Aenigmatarchaeota archaeon]